MITVDTDLLRINGSELVLDAGCGKGRHTWDLCQRNTGMSVGLDIDFASLQDSKRLLNDLDSDKGSIGSWHLITGSLYDLPFSDSTFSKVICSEVLEHIPDDIQAIRELKRVLKPGGILAISVPSFFTESVCWKISDEYHNTPGGHIRIYKQNELIDLLEKQDLQVFAVRYKHGLHSIYWWLKGMFGLKKENALIPSLYHKFLCWEIQTRQKYTKWIDSFLNIFIPKSTVIYCIKPETSA